MYPGFRKQGEGSCASLDNWSVMARWSERARRRLRDGEVVEAAVSVGDNGVVVTSQRVLAFAPEGDGPNYRSVERPNVEGTRLGTIGDERWLGYVLRGGLAAVAGVGVGLTADFGSLLPVGDVGAAGTGAGQVGMGGTVALLRRISRLLETLDEASLVFGLLALAVALAAFGKYVDSRTHALVVDVAGDDDVHVPAPRGSDDARRRIQRTLRETAVEDGRPDADPLGSRPE